MLSGSLDETLILWNLEDGEQIRQFTGHEGAVQTAAIYPDGHRAISGGDDDTVIVWNLDTGEVIRRRTDHTGNVLSIALGMGGHTAFSGSADGTMILWQTLPLDELITWTKVNRFAPDITCAVHTLYQIPGPCNTEAEPTAAIDQ